MGEEVRSALEHEVAMLRAAADVGDGPKRLVVERHDVVRADVEVQLGRPQALGGGLVLDVVDDDVEIARVVIDLRRVDERVVAVIDRQLVEAEDVAQQRLAFAAIDGVEVYPEQPGSVTNCGCDLVGREIEPQPVVRWPEAGCDHNRDDLLGARVVKNVRVIMRRRSSLCNGAH